MPRHFRQLDPIAGLTTPFYLLMQRRMLLQTRSRKPVVTFVLLFALRLLWPFQPGEKGRIFREVEAWRTEKLALDKTVARLNVEHYRKLLANEADEARRQMLVRLLAEEEAKLAALESAPKTIVR